MEQNDLYEILLRVFVNMQDGVCVLDPKGVVMYTNPSVSRIFDCDSARLVGRKLWTELPYSPTNDDFVETIIGAVTDKDSTHNAVVDFDKGNGVPRKLRVCAFYIDADEGAAERYVVLVLTDLTELARVNRAFARYISDDIAEVVLKTPGGDSLGGTTRNITVLMSDLRGFTALSERLSARDLIVVLNHYFERMNEIIEKHRGSLIEFLGDGLFVVFGAPKNNPDHPADAVRCAIEMQNAMPEVNLWNRQQGFPALEMGIGINTGDAVVGNIGSTKRTKYGCMGKNVNLAGRVESYTVGGQILISETTYARIPDPLATRGTQDILPKGAKQPLRIYDVCGLGDLALAAEDKIDLRPLPAPLPVRFAVVNAKAVDAQTHRGEILSLSETHALLRADTPLEKSTNLLLDANGDLYAKIIRATPAPYLLRFTARPAAFETWLATAFAPKP